MTLANLPDPVRLTSASRQLGARYSTVWRLVVDGALPAEQRGKWWYVRVPDLRRALLRAGWKPPTEKPAA